MNTSEKWVLFWFDLNTYLYSWSLPVVFCDDKTISIRSPLVSDPLVHPVHNTRLAPALLSLTQLSLSLFIHLPNFEIPLILTLDYLLQSALLFIIVNFSVFRLTLICFSRLNRPDPLLWWMSNKILYTKSSYLLRRSEELCKPLLNYFLIIHIFLWYRQGTSIDSWSQSEMVTFMLLFGCSWVLGY